MCIRDSSVRLYFLIKSGAVVAVDFYIVVGQVAAPGGGFLVPLVQIHSNIDLVLRQYLGGLFLSEVHTLSLIHISMCIRDRTSSVSVMEAIVSGLDDRYHWGRKKATVICYCLLYTSRCV